MRYVDKVRALRYQKERIESGRVKVLTDYLAEQEIERLRREIRGMGEEPVA